MQALLTAIPLGASAPPVSQVASEAGGEAAQGKETTAFRDLLQSLTSGTKDPKGASTDGSDQPEPDPDVAADGASVQGVLSWLQSTLCQPPTQLVEVESMSSAAGETPGVGSAAADALSPQTAMPFLSSDQQTDALVAPPDAATLEPLVTIGSVEPLPDAAQSAPDLLRTVEPRLADKQQSVGTGSVSEPAIAEESAPVLSNGRVVAFRPVPREATVSEPESTSDELLQSTGRAQSLPRSWVSRSQAWQQTLATTAGQTGEQAVAPHSRQISRMAAVQSMRGGTQVLATGAMPAANSTVPAQLSPEVVQNTEAVYEPVPVASAPVMTFAQSEVAEQAQDLSSRPAAATPDLGQGNASLARPTARQAVQIFPGVFRPLILRDAEPAAQTASQAQTEPRAAGRPEFPVAQVENGKPIETESEPAEKARIGPLSAMPQGEVDHGNAESDLTAKASAPGESVSVVGYPLQMSRPGPAPQTISLVADQQSKPSEQLQSALDVGIKQVRVSADQSGEVTVKMQLYPDDLGEVRVNVRISEGTISAKFQAASPEAAQVIKESLANLRSALDGQGFSQVSLTAESFGSNLAQHSDRRSRRSPMRDERQPSQVRGIVPESAESASTRPTHGLSRLDYRF